MTNENFLKNATKYFVNFFESIQKERVIKYIQNNLDKFKIFLRRTTKASTGLWTIYIYIHYIVVHIFYKPHSMLFKRDYEKSI